MATPHVTGAVALYKARYPTATAAEIKASLLGSVTPTPSLQNGITSRGGRLNAAGMLSVVPPSAPLVGKPPHQWYGIALPGDVRALLLLHACLLPTAVVMLSVTFVCHVRFMMTWVSHVPA